MLMMTPPLLRYFWFHSIYSLAASCSLQSAVCSLRSAVCSLQSAVCSLQSAVCKCHTPIPHYFVSRCWAVFIICVYPFPIHPSCMVSILVSTDFQCDNAWWYLLRGCRGYPAQSILPVSWLHLLQAPFPMLIYY